MKKILILFSTILLLSACGAQKTKQHGNINPPSQVELGKFYFSRGEFDNAARAFSMALKSNPDNATLYFYHGQALARLKLYSKAIDDFSQAIDLKKILLMPISIKPWPMHQLIILMKRKKF